MQIISGKELAQSIKAQVKQDVDSLKEIGITPKLAVIIVGDNPASQVYVQGKEKDCQECGIQSIKISLPENIQQDELLAAISILRNDRNVHGILVQLPLPKHIDESTIISAIPPEKDVDGFTPENLGKLLIGQDCFIPCTPAGCLEMLKSTGVNLEGLSVAMIGRSNIVGKPLAALLTQNNMTVILCHSKTTNLADICKQQDIVISAIGKAKFITKEFISPGTIVIDVGINREENGKLCGDIDLDSVSEVASYITPVPGGVGLMTRAMLMQNTLKAAKASINKYFNNKRRNNHD